MISSIKSLGFKYTSHDDLIDKQFTLMSKNIEEKYTSLSQIRFSEIQVYKLYTKNPDYNYLGLANSLKALHTITRGASTLLIESVTISCEKVENGIEANLEITISEV